MRSLRSDSKKKNWRAEFSIWRPKILVCVSLRGKNFIDTLATTFFHMATEKKFQSPVGACLKKLISDPECMRFGSCLQ